MSTKNKLDGQWGTFGGSAMGKEESSTDPIVTEISKAEEMKKEGATQEVLAAQEKKIWDMIYQRNLRAMLA